MIHAFIIIYILIIDFMIIYILFINHLHNILHLVCVFNKGNVFLML